MNLLVPLGLLGLLGLVVLLIIYILKPNYQQKLISSTYIWKLSLKYRKKKVPISKLRNLLILLCQILILITGALILAKPAVIAETSLSDNEKIIIIDASAGMLATNEEDGKSRFFRAVEKTQEMLDEVLKGDGIITIILAGEKAAYVTQRAAADSADVVSALLDGLTCGLGDADIDGAMVLAEETLKLNDNAEVVLITGTKYLNKAENVTVLDVSHESEWNLAILNAIATLEDNFYTFEIEVAAYGQDKAFEVFCEVSGVNNKDEKVLLPVQTINGFGNQTVKLVYTASTRNLGENVVPVILSDNDRIFSFDEVYIHIDESDSLLLDNEFFIYGGKRPTVKVQYYSSLPNVFFSGALRNLKEIMSSRWNLEIDEVTGDKEPLLTGYDFYIFEHKMPKQLPTDGVIFMVNPNTASDAGFTLLKTNVDVDDYDGDGATLAIGNGAHPIVKFIDVSGIRVTKYSQVDENSLERYDVLMYYEGSPVYFVRNEADSKIAVMTFSLNMSNLAISIWYPMLIYNMFNYFLPSTVSDNIFGVYDTVKVNARGTSVSVVNPDGVEQSLSEFPSDFYIDDFGTYILRQQLISGVIMEEKFYAKVPYAQSNLERESVFNDPYKKTNIIEIIRNLLVYFAAAIVALMFLEWILHSLEGV